jgi:hypothetical protein
MDLSWNRLLINEWKMIYNTALCKIFVLFYTVNLYICAFMTCSQSCCLYETQWNYGMYVRTYVCMCACTYVRTHVCRYICIYTCMYVHMYVCVHAHMYVRMYVGTYVYTHACMYVHMYVCVHAHMYVRMYVGTYVYTHVCMYVCTDLFWWKHPPRVGQICKST